MLKNVFKVKYRKVNEFTNILAYLFRNFIAFSTGTELWNDNPVDPNLCTLF